MIAGGEEIVSVGAMPRLPKWEMYSGGVVGVSGNGMNFGVRRSLWATQSGVYELAAGLDADYYSTFNEMGKQGLDKIRVNGLSVRFALEPRINRVDRKGSTGGISLVVSRGPAKMDKFNARDATDIAIRMRWTPDNIGKEQLFVAVLAGGRYLRFHDPVDAMFDMLLVGQVGVRF